jgi:ATP-dependent Clp protease ATP-binding subunit ClpC
MIFEKFTANAKKAIIASYELARNDYHNPDALIEPRHLFAAILLDRQNLAARLLEKLDIDLNQTAEAVLGPRQDNYSNLSYLPSEDYKRILGEAILEAAQLGHVYVGCEHILLSLLKEGSHLPFVQDLEKSGLSYEHIRSEVLGFGSYQPGVFSKQQAPMGEEQANNNSALDYFGRSMNQLASEGKYLPILGRDAEIERLIHILSRQTKNNPILVGEAGVGKTAIIEGFVQRIEACDVPHSLRDLEVIQIDIAAIIAGAKIRGDVEERLLAILNEVQKSKNKVIFIDEVHMIVGSGAAGGSSDVANVLKPYLTSGDMRVIGATTRDEYRKYFEDDAALSRRFQPIFVEELNQDASLAVLKHLQPVFEKYHKVKILPEALQEAVKLSARYISDRYLPDKAIDLIDEAAAKQKIRRDKKAKPSQNLENEMNEVKRDKSIALEEGNVELASNLRSKELELKERITKLNRKSSQPSSRYKVEADDIRDIVAAWTKIPVRSLNSNELKSISNLEQTLTKEIVGQKDALARIASILKRAKLGLQDANRPLASFLFLGPTGVGKTETAKVIAEELFGEAGSLIQVNMSEMMEQHSVSKIIGAPPGYVGYQDGNHLAEQVRQKPYSVVLFDEIEKAHPDLLNIMLQILDEGYVQDSKGRKISFKNTVVIMTSNIGAEAIAEDKVLGFQVFAKAKGEDLEEAYSDMREKVMGELKGYLRPEFINRIDEIIVFRGLNQKDAEEITKLQLDKLNQRLREKHILLKVSSPLLAKIAEDGFSKDYGARNLKRKVQELLENNLAEYLLSSGLVLELEKRQKKQDPLLEISAKSDGDAVKFNS